jgi:hypothetical protein
MSYCSQLNIAAPVSWQVSVICAGAIVVLGSGCSEWPRFGNLPESTGYSSDVDPRTFFDIEWSEVAEPAEEDPGNDSSVTASTIELDYENERAVLISGTLEGTGWSDNASKVMIDNAGCTGAVAAPRSPLETGEYIHDVDFFNIDMVTAGTLCVAVTHNDSSLGWDLLLYALDDCDIPSDPIELDSEVLGFAQGGTSGGWGYSVGAGERYSILFAGYAPNDPLNDKRAVNYEIGISTVPNETNGNVGLCPLLDEEEEES